MRTFIEYFAGMVIVLLGLTGIVIGVLAGIFGLCTIIDLGLSHFGFVGGCLGFVADLVLLALIATIITTVRNGNRYYSEDDYE